MVSYLVSSYTILQIYSHDGITGNHTDVKIGHFIQECVCDPNIFGNSDRTFLSTNKERALLDVGYDYALYSLLHILIS